MKKEYTLQVMGILRLAMGWIFLWAFLDKTFGWGFATTPGHAWLAGGSPTTGFLSHATTGPFATLFASMAGHPSVDWLFMIGLLCLGLALIFGVGVRIAMYSGVLLLALMYLALLPTENNPFVDEHVLEALILILIGVTPNAGSFLGLGKWWGSTELVKKYPILK